MPGIRCKYNQLFAIAGIMLLLPMSASAKCGGVDYSWGADALSNAHDFTVTMMLYVVYLLYAISAIVAIIGALQIYIGFPQCSNRLLQLLEMLVKFDRLSISQYR